MASIDLQELLDLVTPEIVVQIMKENGSEVYDRTMDRRTGQSCLWFKTICHGGDSHKLCFFTQTKDFYCYTNCGKMNFWDGIKTIRDIKDGEFGKVVEYIRQKVGKPKKDRTKISGKLGTREVREELLELEELFEERERKNKEKVVIDNFYDENILKFFDHNTFYQGWINEGISIESMQKFGICWYEYQKAIVIPHRNIDGKLVGIRRRSLLPEMQNSAKYMPLYISQTLYDHPLGLNLYGLYENKDYIKKAKKVIIVEGEKSVLLADTYYQKSKTKPYICATCGFNISDWQLTQLLKLGCEEIIIGFDKDFDITKIDNYKKDNSEFNKYCNYINKLKSLSSRIIPFCTVSIILDTEELLGEKDSPLDKGKEIFEQLMKKRMRVTSKINNKVFEVLEEKER